MKRLRRGSGVMLGLLWLCVADLATAGDYALAVGKGIEICEAYLKNLNSFPKHPPMVCERPLNPKLTDFTKPSWKELNAQEHLELLKQIWRSFDDLTAEQFEQSPLKDQWIASLKKPGEAKGIVIQTAELDVDRDGVPELVLHYFEEGTCNPTDQGMYAHPYGRKYYVLSPDGQHHVDAYKSKNFGLQWGRPELLLYQGHAYITRWTGGSEFKRGALWLESPANMQQMDRQVCKFLYKPSKQRRSS